MTPFAFKPDRSAERARDQQPTRGRAAERQLLRETDMKIGCQHRVRILPGAPDFAYDAPAATPHVCGKKEPVPHGDGTGTLSP
jgi:hypothetical protein